MRFGGQTVTFITNTESPDSRDRYNNPAEIRTEVEVPGCRFRPLTFSEEIDESGDKTVERWKLTAPPVPAAIDAQPRGELKADGVKYQIVGGAQVFTDMAGKPFKLTVVCERRTR